MLKMHRTCSLSLLMNDAKAILHDNTGESDMTNVDLHELSWIINHRKPWQMSVSK